MKTLLVTLLTALITINTGFAAATKLQKQAFKTHAECAAAGVSDANCFLGTDQLYDTTNSQTLQSSIAAGILGGGGAVGTVNNLINKDNPDAEKGSTTGWTNSGGTFGVINSGQADGLYSFQFTTSGSAQSVSSTLASIPALSYGKAGLIRFTYSTAQTDWVLQAYDGTNIIASQTLPSTSGYQYGSVSFLIPSSGSVQVKIVSGTGAGEVISFDDVYLGENFQISQVSQMQLIGALKITGCASQWQVNSLTLAAPAAQTGCVYTATGAAQAPSTNVPAIKFANLGPGHYRVEYEGEIEVFPASATMTSQFQFWDGTNTANETSSLSGFSGNGQPTFTNTFDYTTAQSNVTLAVRMANNQGGSNSAIWGTTAVPGYIRVYKVPTQSQTAATPDTSAMSWSGTLVGAGGGWSLTSTGAYVDFSVATTSTTLTQITNTNMGSVVAEATKLPAITWTPKRADTFFVCASVSGSNSGAQNNSYRLVDGSGTVINGGTSGTNTTSGGNAQATLCGIYAAANTSAVTFKIQGLTTGTTANIVESSLAPITWSIVDISQNLPGPVLQNQVTTSNSGGVRTFAARVGTTGTILSQLGSEFTSCSGGGGTVTCTVASGMCSSAMMCTCSAESASPAACSFPSVPTSTSVATVTATTNFYLSCSCAK